MDLRWISSLEDLEKTYKEREVKKNEIEANLKEIADRNKQ